MVSRKSQCLSALFASCCFVLHACNVDSPLHESIEANPQSQLRPIVAGVEAGEVAKSVQTVILSAEGLAQCGASYIGTNDKGEAWVVTAAHCAVALSKGSRFGFGGLKLSEYTLNNTVEWSETIPYPEWNAETIENDIALIRLSEEPTGAAPVVLADSDNDADIDETVTISGYGISEEKTSFYCVILGWCAKPEVLLEANTLVVDQETCEAAYARNGFGFDFDADTYICVNDVENAQSACNGDSGGPMFRDDGVVAGVTSFGHKWCSPEYPVVYTKISAYRDWIEDVTGI